MTNIRLEDTIQRVGTYPFQKVLDETVIVEPRAKLMHQLDEVASDIWELLAKPRPVREIINLIAEDYDVDHKTVQADITQFLRAMMKRNLITVKT